MSERSGCRRGDRGTQPWPSGREAGNCCIWSSVASSRELDSDEFKDLDKFDIVGIYPELCDRLCRLEGEGAADRRQRPDALFHRSPAPAARSGHGSARQALTSRRSAPRCRGSSVSWPRPRSSGRPGPWRPSICALVWKTTRFVVEPEGIYERVDRDVPVIIAMWHGQHFLAPFIRRADDRAKVLVSRHRDGEINALAAERARHRRHSRLRPSRRRVHRQGRGERLQGRC